MTKDTGEQPDEDIYRVRSGRVLNTKASVPMELGGVTLPVRMTSPVWRFQKPLLLGFLWKLPHICVVND